MPDDNGNRQTFLKNLLGNTGSYFNRQGAPGNQAGYFEEDEDDPLVQALAASQPLEAPAQQARNTPPGYRLTAPSPQTPQISPIQGPQLDIASLNIPSFDAPSDMAAGLTGQSSFLVDPSTYAETEEPMAPEAEGPRSFWDKVGGGLKGALTSPGVGDALIATGTRVMSEGFGGLGQGLREGVAELEEGRQERKYRDTIEEVGFGMPEEENAIMASMPPAQGMEFMMKWRDSERGRNARAAGLMRALNIDEEQALQMGWDAATVDRILSRPNELQTITDGRGQTWVVNLRAGLDDDERVAGGPIGAARIDLTGEQLKLQKDALEQAGQLPLFERVQEQYTANEQSVRGLAELETMVDFLSEKDDEGNYVNAEGHFGPFSDIKAGLDAIVNNEGVVNRQAMQKVLLSLGINNLGMFKGAISEMELAKALEEAGNFTDLREALLSKLNLARARTQGIMDDHQADVEYLRDAAGTDLMLDRWELRFDPELKEQIRTEMNLAGNTQDSLPEGSELVSGGTQMFPNRLNNSPVKWEAAPGGGVHAVYVGGLNNGRVVPNSLRQ